MNQDLMFAILAMDSYNRRDPNPGPNTSPSSVGIDIGETSLGFWNLFAQLDQSSNDFYAQAYSYNGQIVISYRGTDTLSDLPDWATGAGAYLTDQTILAAQFYRAIAAQNSLSQITLTGHSLGGGLAGFVGSLYGVDGVLFDNMPYELAARRLHDDATALDPNTGDVIDPLARQEFYGSAPPWAIDGSGLSGYAVQGEVLGAARTSQSMLPTEWESPWGDVLSRHKQSLLVIHAKQIEAITSLASKNAAMGAY